MKEAFNFNSRYSEDQRAHAKWRRIHTFEAEYTDLDGMPGYGYSGSNSDVGLINKDNTENLTASNGYYVAWLFYEDAYLEFVIEAEEEARDVTVAFRISAEYDNLTVTGDQVCVRERCEI